MERKVKDLTFELKAVGDDGTVEGWGSIFGELDSYNDIVVAGAFRKTLADRGSKIRMLWQHDTAQPIGVWQQLSEQDKGLRVKGKINLDVQQGREAYSLLKMGALDGLSIGFIPVQQDIDPKTGINYIREVKLYETSIVTFPACENANVVSVKSAFEDLSEENRVKVIQFINNLKQSPLESTEKPPTVEASTGNTSEDSKPVEQKDTKPQSDEVVDSHLLEQLLEALKQRKEMLQ